MNHLKQSATLLLASIFLALLTVRCGLFTSESDVCLLQTKSVKVSPVVDSASGDTTAVTADVTIHNRSPQALGCVRMEFRVQTDGEITSRYYEADRRANPVDTQDTLFVEGFTFNNVTDTLDVGFRRATCGCKN